MDRKGSVKHVWTFDPDLWADLERVQAPLLSTIYPVGLHLFENGDLLVSYQGENTFPYAIGMARFDKDSNLIWKKEGFYHHWFSVAVDGRIYSPSLSLEQSPWRIGTTRFDLICHQGLFNSDEIAILDPNGTVMERISILKALIDSGLPGLFRGYDEDSGFHQCDPTHLNDVRLVDAALAADHPLLKEGDMLVSLRQLNMVGILDGGTRRFKWISTGTTIRQHSPRLNGSAILVLDNRGGVHLNGDTQILAIELASGLSQLLYPLPGGKGINKPGTETAGHLDIHPNGHRLLLALTHQGLVQEIDLSSGTILWEFIHGDKNKEGPLLHPIYTAKYVFGVVFPFNVR